MIFELTILGSSSALPTSTKFPAAHVLNIHERFFLIDCGEGAQIQLRRSGVRFGKVNHIFISHMHGDHVFGLFGVLSTFNLLGRKNALHIYGIPDLRHLIDFYIRYFAEESSYPLEFHPLRKRELQLIHEDKVVEVHAFPLKHRVPTFGYLFREKPRSPNIRKELISEYRLTIKQIRELIAGHDITTDTGVLLTTGEATQPPYRTRSFAYCSDTMMYKKILPVIENVDLLYHEATFLETEKTLAKLTGHSTALQAASMAKEAGARELIIGHFSNRYKDSNRFFEEAQRIFPNTRIAEELSTYSVPLVREV
jgi:ribonuclease Z